MIVVFLSWLLGLCKLPGTCREAQGRLETGPHMSGYCKFPPSNPSVANIAMAPSPTKNARPASAPSGGASARGGKPTTGKAAATGKATTTKTAAKKPGTPKAGGGAKDWPVCEWCKRESSARTSVLSIAADDSQPA